MTDPLNNQLVNLLLPTPCRTDASNVAGEKIAVLRQCERAKDTAGADIPEKPGAKRGFDLLLELPFLFGAEGVIVAHNGNTDGHDDTVLLLR